MVLRDSATCRNGVSIRICVVQLPCLSSGTARAYFARNCASRLPCRIPRKYASRMAPEVSGKSYAPAGNASRDPRATTRNLLSVVQWQGRIGLIFTYYIDVAATKSVTERWYSALPSRENGRAGCAIVTNSGRDSPGLGRLSGKTHLQIGFPAVQQKTP